MGIYQSGTDPKEPIEKNNRIYARGASDMERGLAAMMYLFYYMKEKNKLERQVMERIRKKESKRKYMQK